jgi:inner membrane protease subunit 1
MPPLSRFLLLFKYAKERYVGHPLRLSIAALKTILLAHVFWQYGYSLAPLQGPSMLPTFEVAGDSVIVSRYYRRGRGVKVGDLVSFDSVVEPGESVLKRVLGLQGDYVLRDTPGTTDSMIQVREKSVSLAWRIVLISLGTGRPLLGHWR